MPAVSDALAVDDLDRAIEAGLLQWNGCISCAIAGGLTRAEAERLHAARASRLSALAARERHRVRQQRLLQRGNRRDAARGVPGARTPSQSLDLPSAAAAALARAKAKAAARAKP